MKKRKQSNFKKWGLTTVKAVVIILAFYGLVSLAGDLQALTQTNDTISPASKTKLNKEITTSTWLKAINKERNKVGSPPLKLDKRLNKSATKKLNDLLTEGLDSTPHVNDRGVYGQDYIKQYWPNCYAGGENLVWYFDNVADAVDWWMHSPSHKKTLLDPQYQYTGFGFNNEIAVEHFCRTLP